MHRSWIFVLVGLALTLGTDSSSAAQRGTILPFWAGPKVKDRYPAAVVSEHGLCDGDVAEVAISRMPPESDEALEPEKVLELDSAGHVIRKWRMPIDTAVVAIRGQQIIVPRPYRDAAANDEVLYIDPDGRFRLEALDISRFSEPTQMQCPKLAEFGESAYVTCVVFRDLKDSTQRRIAYQSPCT